MGESQQEPEVAKFRHMTVDTNGEKYEVPTQLIRRPPTGNTTGIPAAVNINSYPITAVPSHTVYQYDVSHLTFFFSMPLTCSRIHLHLSNEAYEHGNKERFFTTDLGKHLLISMQIRFMWDLALRNALSSSVFGHPTPCELRPAKGGFSTGTRLHGTSVTPVKQ